MNTTLIGAGCAVGLLVATSALAWTGDECDDCLNAGPVNVGWTIDNTGTTGDDTTCGFNDVIDEWRCWTAPCDGMATADTFGSDFDTTLAVFDGCDGLELACNDDAGGTVQSEVQWTVTAGTTYYIRISGYDGTIGIYELNIDCSATGPCPGEGDCCMSNGTPGCDDTACCLAVCAIDPFCCDVAWDNICADEAQDLCDCAPPCPGDGDCCLDNGTPGCEDEDCCLAVCAIDPFCCDVAWDGLCAAEAQDLCACTLELFADIKPGSCPNPFNPKSRGYVPVAVLGGMDFDVAMIDLETVVISRADGMGGMVAPNFGPPGPSPSYEDVASPFMGDLCDCHDFTGDGFIDLALKFKNEMMRDNLMLDMLQANEHVVLVVSGSLLDGTPFVASDCVIIRPARERPAK